MLNYLGYLEQFLMGEGLAGRWREYPSSRGVGIDHTDQSRASAHGTFPNRATEYILA
jgi:hypothetical protein